MALFRADKSDSWTSVYGLSVQRVKMSAYENRTAPSFHHSSHLSRTLRSKLNFIYAIKERKMEKYVHRNRVPLRLSHRIQT